MATSKLNLGIGAALLIAVLAVVVLLLMPPAAVQAPAAPADDMAATTTSATPDPTESDADTQTDTASETTEAVEHFDQIRVSTPLPESTITSPLIIEGEARGTWFFEGDFPVMLTNWDGLIIAEGFASAEGDWMTEEYVPFTAELTFTPDTSVSNRATLILQKDNPSDLPENDDAFEYTVYFAE